MNQPIIFTMDVRGALMDALDCLPHDRLFVLTDENTHRLCLPVLEPCLSDTTFVSIPAGDAHKNLENLSRVWKALQEGGATRHSLLLNLGGGMVTDLGGLAASTFKRGIRFVNIPTTLLAMVDASVGGKTGINFGGLKNEVGTFCEADRVIVGTEFLQTLDRANILSGYAEMLKHGLISDAETWAELLRFDIERTDCPEVLASLAPMLARSVAVKERIVGEDPHEQGIRKALNLGHTVGHAIESLRQGSLLHGHCVAHGLVSELYLSCIKAGFPTEPMRQTVRFILAHYGPTDITCDDYPALLALMRHDKKNIADRIRFTLLGGIGDIRIDQTATEEEIKESLDFLREGA